jgi:hypothetical protein
MTTYTLNLFFDPNHEDCQKGLFLPYPQNPKNPPDHPWDFNFYSMAWIKKTDTGSSLIGEDSKVDFHMKPGDQVQVVLGIAQALKLVSPAVKMTVMCSRSGQDESKSESSPFRLNIPGLRTPLAIFDTIVSILPDHPGDTDWWMLNLGTVAPPAEGVNGERKIELFIGATVVYVDPNSQAPQIFQLTHDPVMRVDEEG